MSGCGFDVADIEPPEHYSDLNGLSESWTCPREAITGENHCQYHLSEDRRDALNISDEELVEDLKQELQGKDGVLDFVGCSLPELDLSGLVIRGSEDMVDFRFATIGGRLDLTDTKFTLPLYADGITIGRGGIDCDNAHFTDKVRFYAARVKGSFDGKGVQFHGDVLFSRMKLTNSIKLYDNTRFEESAYFSKITITGRGGVNLRGSEFDKNCFFRDVEAPKIECKGTTFEGKVFFTHVTLEDDLDCSRARFNRNVVLGGKDKKSTTEKDTKVNGSVIFKDVIAQREVDLSKAKLYGGIDFSEADFNGPVSLVMASIHECMTLTNTTFRSSFELKPMSCKTSSDDPLVVECDGTRLSEGELSQPSHEHSVHLLYNVRNATLGDVQFSDVELVGDKIPFLLDCCHYSPTLEYVEFESTRFQDFDFTHYHDSLNDSWTLHCRESENDVADSENQSTSRPSFLDRGINWLDKTRPIEEISQIERTYRFAKRGAKNIGDNRASSEFFVKELDSRAILHSIKGEESDSLRDKLYHWRKSLELRAWRLIKYGESAKQVSIYAFIAAGLFSFIYWLFSFAGIGGTPYPEAGIFGYLIFSMESFVSLVHVPGTSVDSLVVRFLSTLEGFIGAFFIGLFVFSLTRTVHR